MGIGELFWFVMLFILVAFIAAGVIGGTLFLMVWTILRVFNAMAASMLDSTFKRLG